MIDDVSHLLFCYTSYLIIRTKTLNKNYFHKKAVTTSMLDAQCCPYGQHRVVSVASAGNIAYLSMSRDAMWTNHVQAFCVKV